MRIEQLTCNIGAELLDVSLRDAAHDDGLFDEVYAALLKHRVLFLRGQDSSGADHVACQLRDQRHRPVHSGDDQRVDRLHVLGDEGGEGVQRRFSALFAVEAQSNAHAISSDSNVRRS